MFTLILIASLLLVVKHLLLLAWHLLLVLTRSREGKSSNGPPKDSFALTVRYSFTARGLVLMRWKIMSFDFPCKQKYYSIDIDIDIER